MSIEGFKKLYGLKSDPVFFGENKAKNYASKAKESVNLETSKNGLIKRAASLVPEAKEHSRALDIGCGEGRWSRFLSTKGYNVLAIDESRSMIEIAKNLSINYRNIEYYELQVDKLGRLEESFDLGIASYILNNIQNVSRFFQSASHLINIGGYLIIITKTLNISEELARRFDGYFLPIKLRNECIMYTTPHSCNKYIKAAKEFGFAVEEIYKQASKDYFDNENINDLDVKIENLVVKFKKVDASSK